MLEITALIIVIILSPIMSISVFILFKLRRDLERIEQAVVSLREVNVELGRTVRALSHQSDKNATEKRQT